jgi:hypothetical protein
MWRWLGNESESIEMTGAKELKGMKRSEREAERGYRRERSNHGASTRGGADTDRWARARGNLRGGFARTLRDFTANHKGHLTTKLRGVLCQSMHGPFGKG